MGYKFQLKKQEREKLLREKMKAQLLVMDAPLLQSGDDISITYTCEIHKRHLKTIKIGITGLLIEERGKIAFWNTVRLGHLCADDTPELLEYLDERSEEHTSELQSRFGISY